MKDHQQHCLNCNHIVQGKYCSNCGQSIKTGKITWMHLIKDIQFNFLHLNKGVFYTVVMLFIKPNQVISNYITGKRVNYINPLQYLLLGASFYMLLVHYFNVLPILSTVDTDSGIDFKKIYAWYYDHYSFSLLFTIPFFSFASYLVYRNKGYTFLEHIVIYLYIGGNKVILLMFMYPIFLEWNQDSLLNSMQIVLFIYNVWVLFMLFRTKKVWFDLLKAIVCVLISFIIPIILFIVIISLLFKL